MARSWFHNALSGRLFRTIFGTYFLITLLVTAVQLGIEYTHVKENVVDDLHSLTETFKPVLAESLWKYDEAALQTALFSMLRLESVIGVKILDHHGKVIKTAGVVDGKAEDLKTGGSFSNQIFHDETPLNFEDAGGRTQILGKAVLYSSSSIVFEKIKYGFILIIINSVIKTTALWLIFVFFLRRVVSRPLTQLTRSVTDFDIEKFSGKDDNLDRLSRREDEIGILSRKFAEMTASSVKMLEKLKEQSRLEGIAKMARQLAHDIRSPLAALNAASSFITELSEDKRVLLRRAVQRIDDIANDLSRRSLPSESKIPLENGEGVEVHLISEVIEAIVSEKRLQYRTKRKINIDFILETANYGLFAKINPVLLKRVLSNLIDNSVDAIERDDGHIDVSLSAHEDHVVMSVRDDGSGIPQEIIPQLMKEGATFGKKQGNGLGLFFAKSTIESWNGTISISSATQGTEIKIQIPRAAEPAWFVRELALDPRASVVILDDDDSIHEIWRGRFNRHDLRTLSVHHFRNPNEVISWVTELDRGLENIVFLFDYELIGYQLTGLDIIEKLGISSQSILVTSRFDEPSVRASFIKKSIRLIPKSLAGFVPINRVKCHNDATNPEYILIDDDDMVRENWMMVASHLEKKLVTYSQPQEFLERCSAVDKNALIYVDSNLGDGLKGEDICLKLRSLGFNELYLCTGDHPSKFADVSWVKGVIGKNPPFYKKAV